MKAILVNPSSYPILTRPMIHLVMETLASCGVQQVTCVGDVERGVGNRFGIEAVYSRRPICEIAAEWANEKVYLAAGDVLPLVPPSDHQWYFFPEGEWTGWALVDAMNLMLVPDTAHHEELPELIEGGGGVVVPEKLLSVRSYDHLYRSNMQALIDPTYHELFAGSVRCESPGIWLSHEVKIHEGVTIKPPVLIGEECEIFPGATIGPHVVVGNRCIIDEGCQIERALVLDETFIGEGMKRKECILGEGKIVDMMSGTVAVIDDPLVLGDVKKPALFHKGGPK